MMPPSARPSRRGVLAIAALLLLLVSAPLPGAARAAEPLASWKEGPARQAILAFVERVTREGGPDYVPAEERIAVFDNDGTLWSNTIYPFEAK